jgi:CHASE2 domain-containing sensor protein
VGSAMSSTSHREAVSSQPTSTPHSRRRRLAEHWLIAVFLGAFVALFLTIIAPLAPLRLMEWLGTDAIQDLAASAGASRLDWKPRIVFVSIDDATMHGWGARTGRQARSNIAQLIALVRKSAKIVVLDITFEAPPSASRITSSCKKR